MIGQLKAEARSIVHQCVELAYFMRGAIQYHDLLQMSFAEREIVRDFIEKRLETQKKAMHPVF